MSPDGSDSEFNTIFDLASFHFVMDPKTREKAKVMHIEMDSSNSGCKNWKKLQLSGCDPIATANSRKHNHELRS
jgi:hypothetical protein